MLQKKYDNKEKNLQIIKNSLTYVLTTLGASESFIESSLNDIISSELSYSFVNDFMKVDFGDDVNQSVSSSTIVTHFNASAALYKVHVEFRDEVKKSTMVMIYNADMDFVDYQFKEDIPSRHRYYQNLCDLEFELKRSLISQLKRLPSVFKCDENLLDKFFNQIYLTKHHDYHSVGENTKNMKFSLSYSSQKFAIKTNIFSINVDYFNHSKSVDRYKITQDIISFDSDLSLWRYQKKYFADKHIKIDLIPTNGLSNEDFYFLLNLKFCPHPEIHDILPELMNPSAYNFNSIDFKNRLNTAEMLLF